ncbi:serine hydrolase domain-containing protein [Microbacterium sp. X-17]|uniref:serine hydrolase domain-containing protein n=1 Tax=Microbacterium sp. X-17 TaxID=3144404 RepID=UPI0031F54B8E
MSSRRGGRRLGAIVVGVVAVAVLVAGCSGGSVRPNVPSQASGALAADMQSQLQDAAEFAMKASGSSGALVGVWAPWSGTWVVGLGVADTATGAAADPAMSFRATTLTRPMTCDVLYALVANGTVSPSDLVSKYVPTVIGLNGVTLGELCDGTSGVGSYRPSVESMWLQNPGRVWDPRELVSYGIGRLAASAPGTAWVDSDAGYQLLGLALEAASGRKAADLYGMYVTGPLGLSQTALPDPAPADPGRDPLHGYVSARGADGAVACTAPTDVTDLSSSIGFTDSGVVSTLDDAKTYTQALAAGSLLPSGVDRFASAKSPSADAPTWFTTGGGAFRAGSLVGQYGSVPGYLTASFADPGTGLTVVVVLNDSAAPAQLAGDLAWQLAAIASKATPAAGRDAATSGLPWTAPQLHDAIAKSAVCPVS